MAVWTDEFPENGDIESLTGGWGAELQGMSGAFSQAARSLGWRSVCWRSRMMPNGWGSG